MNALVRMLTSMFLIAFGMYAIAHDHGVDRPEVIGTIGLVLCLVGCVGLIGLALGDD